MQKRLLPARKFTSFPHGTWATITILAMILTLDTVNVRALYGQQLQVHVDTNRPAQNMFGFGAGSVFYSNSLLYGHTKSQRAEVWDWLWKDIEENLFMYQIQGKLEETNDNDDPFVLDRSKLDYKSIDRLAKLMLEAQKRRGKEKMVFIASLYSPPPWLKDNRKTKGGGFDTSKDVNFLEAAEFIYAGLDRLRTEHGIDTKCLCIANEPDFDHKQPGCKWSPQDYAKHMAITVDHLRTLVKRTEGMTMPKIIAGNTLSVRGANRYMKAILESPYRDARKNVDTVGAHLYDSSVTEKDYRKISSWGVPFWMTEWTGPRKMDKRIKSPLTHSLGQMIGRITAMHGGASVIMHFEFAHPKLYTAGILLAHSKEPIKRDTPYYVFQQMANLTPVGDGAFKVASAVEGLGDEWANHTIAFIDAENRVATVHLINPTPQPINVASVDLGGKGLKKVRGFITSGDQNHAEIPADVFKLGARNVLLPLPALSFVTVQIEY